MSARAIQIITVAESAACAVAAAWPWPGWYGAHLVLRVLLAVLYGACAVAAATFPLWGPRLKRLLAAPSAGKDSGVNA